MTWSIEQLEELRQIADKQADAAVHAIFESKQSSFLRETLSKMASNDSNELGQSFPESMIPGPLYDLINTELTQQFTDEDITMFQKAHEIWKAKGVRFVYVLFFRSLVYTYYAEKPANVLRLTRLLETHPRRRIIETAQFVFDVMDKDWWTPGKRGIITTVKIRLMHSAMRYMLLNHEALEPYEADKWGQPISQEDMVATNQVFSLTFIEGMNMLNDVLTPDEQEAWYYTWRRVGKMLGVEDELLSASVAEANELQLAIYKHLFNAPDHKSGVELSQALVVALEGFFMPEKFVLIQMKKMLHDNLFPQIFNELLGPTYEAKYPGLFAENVSSDGLLPEHVYDEFAVELLNFHTAITSNRATQKANLTPNNIQNTFNITDKHLDLLQTLMGDMKKLPVVSTMQHDFEEIKAKTADVFHRLLGSVEHVQAAEELALNIVKLKDKMMIMAIDSVSIIIIDLLSVYFREGKYAGFRISDDLKEHWELE